MAGFSVDKKLLILPLNDYVGVFPQVCYHVTSVLYPIIPANSDHYQFLENVFTLLLGILLAKHQV